ncbi:MAG: ATP phosphoribosyltransferase regulatory subunit, partial [bacterium]|nr:ATP phosphoribosyltransferase regulatory subunit [bacterium]
MKTLKGFRDIYGLEALKLELLIDFFKEHVKKAGYIPVFLPIVEERQLFEKSLGEGSSVVSQKQMFEVTNYGVLRPEATAQIVRFYYSNGLHKKSTTYRFYTYGVMFRGENPQKGRYRQFNQFGIEFLMEKSAYADFEVIKIAYQILNKLGIRFELNINSIGCSCRKGFEDKLYEFLKSKKLCEVCSN